ncbi:hypothetical protein AB0M54_24225 [Actinoplanes sp. NPDC051470]|uniref:hypothetical protein n=1 Tax=Actinoplanes sp. NPDC051470 TaxID=3157224 RepID=UPI0034181EA1
MSGQRFKVNDMVTLENPRLTDPYFIQFQRTVRVLDVIPGEDGDQLRVFHRPAPNNPQEYVMPADRFKPARKVAR